MRFLSLFGGGTRKKDVAASSPFPPSSGTSLPSPSQATTPTRSSDNNGYQLSSLPLGGGEDDLLSSPPSSPGTDEEEKGGRPTVIQALTRPELKTLLIVPIEEEMGEEAGQARMVTTRLRIQKTGRGSSSSSCSDSPITAGKKQQKKADMAAAGEYDGKAILQTLATLLKVRSHSQYPKS